MGYTMKTPRKMKKKKHKKSRGEAQGLGSAMKEVGTGRRANS